MRRSGFAWQPRAGLAPVACVLAEAAGGIVMDGAATLERIGAPEYGPHLGALDRGFGSWADVEAAQELGELLGVDVVVC